jgi:hypothetical protein
MTDALERDAGPSGWTEFAGERIELDGWEIFEGDEDSPNMCRGWFRCEVDLFDPLPSTELDLHLTSETGEQRDLAVRIVRKSTTGPIWEFRADLQD